MFIRKELVLVESADGAWLYGVNILPKGREVDYSVGEDAIKLRRSRHHDLILPHSGDCITLHNGSPPRYCCLE
jgi:hypothetical protein